MSARKSSKDTETVAKVAVAVAPALPYLIGSGLIALGGYALWTSPVAKTVMSMMKGAKVVSEKLKGTSLGIRNSVLFGPPVTAGVAAAGGLSAMIFRLGRGLVGFGGSVGFQEFTTVAHSIYLPAASFLAAAQTTDSWNEMLVSGASLTALSAAANHFGSDLITGLLEKLVMLEEEGLYQLNFAIDMRYNTPSMVQQLNELWTAVFSDVWDQLRMQAINEDVWDLEQDTLGWMNTALDEGSVRRFYTGLQTIRDHLDEGHYVGDDDHPRMSLDDIANRALGGMVQNYHDGWGINDANLGQPMPSFCSALLMFAANIRARATAGTFRTPIRCVVYMVGGVVVAYVLEEASYGITILYNKYLSWLNDDDLARYGILPPSDVDKSHEGEDSFLVRVWHYTGGALFGDRPWQDIIKTLY